MQTIWIDLLGYGGVLANLTWPMMRSRRLLLAGQGVACALMLMHFTLLGAKTGAAIMAVVGTQALLAIPLGTVKGFKWVYLASLCLIPWVAWSTWQGLPSVFSSLALVCACLGNFQLDIFKQRIGLILAICAWYGHNALVWSVPGLLSNTLGMMVSLMMLRRLYLERLKLKHSLPASAL